MNLIDDIASKEVSEQISPCNNASDPFEDFARKPKGVLECSCFAQFGFNPNRTHPIRFSLQTVNWSVVGTLTWKSPMRRNYNADAEKFRRIDFKHLLKKTCSTLKVRFENVFYYHATEHGAGESHLHFLLWIKSERVSNFLFAKTMEDFWQNNFVPFDNLQASGGAGTAVITPYDSTKGNAAVDYCLKREFDERGQHRERYDDPSENLVRYLVKKNAQNN